MIERFVKHIKQLLNRSIKSRMILYFSIFIIVLLAFIGVASYSVSATILVDEIIGYTNKLIEQTLLNVDSYFEDVKYTTLFISINENVKQLMTRYNYMDWPEKEERMRKEKDETTAISRIKPNIYDIIIVGKNGFVDNTSSTENIDLQYDFYKQPWLSKVLKNDLSGIHFISVHPQDYYGSISVNSSLKKGSMTVSVIAFPKDSLYGDVGFVMCDFKLEKINQAFQLLKLENGGEIYLVDDEGVIVFHPDSQLVGKKINNMDHNIIFDSLKKKGTHIKSENGEKTLILYSTSSVNNWKVVASIPMSNIYQKAGKVRDLTEKILIICIALVVFLSFLISSGITKPLSNLVKYMKMAEEGNFDIKVTRKGYGEVAELEKRFKEMLSRIDSLIKDVYQTRIKQRETEYELLQSQINPHFLYNTLQVIKAEAVLRDNTKISEMITSLGYLLRYAIYANTEMVKFKDEIEYIQNYIYICNCRFRKRISFNLNVDEEVLQYRTPKLILQPILENAIIHGLNDKFKNAEVDIKISIKDSCYILIEVFDNGTGMDEDTLKAVRQRLENVNDEKSVGLKNVNDRIKIKFGSEYGVTIESQLGRFTLVKIILPAIGGLKG